MIEKPPKHLRPATKTWFSSVLDEYSLEPHHIKLLILAAESWGRCCEARELLSAHGLTFIDRYGSPRARPEAAIESQSRIAGSGKAPAGIAIE
jgi:hypothetical protein